MTLAYALEHAGVAVAAITGALAARGKRIDLFGVCVLALVTALGGGTLRDLVLGVPRVFWAEDAAYVYTALAAAVFTFVVVRFARFPGGVLLVADAFVLAFFTIVGIKKAMAYDHSAVVGVVMGVITGVAGGMMRDLLLGEIPLVFRPETCLYATAAFGGSVVFLALREAGVQGGVGTLAATGAILGMRLAGIRWGLTLPVFTVHGERTSRVPEDGGMRGPDGEMP